VDNGGAGRARNLGVQAARNSLVAFLDSDDAWMSGKLALQRALMEHDRGLVFSFSDFAVRDAEGEFRHYLQRWHNDPRSWSEILGQGPGRRFSTIAALPSKGQDFLVYTGDLYLPQMSAPYVFTSTVVVRREMAGTALHFAEDLPTYEDWECFGRLAGAGRAAYLQTETAWQFGHPGPRLTDANVLARTYARLNVLERVWGCDPLFLAQHGPEYAQVVHGQHLERSAALFRVGRNTDAYAELALADAPRAYGAFFALVGTLSRVRRGLRSLWA
jgi:glycosyltransferase involved in cell wall biosynthesis